MKNTKTILGSSAAIVAAAALVAGGTFAAWSDFAVVTGNTATAGALILDADTTSITTNGGGGPLAPGENKTTYKYIANRSDNTVSLQDALLTLEIENVQDQDNGCSSNGEGFAETGVMKATYPDTNCDGDGGEFSQQAFMQIRKSAVVNVAAAADCASVSTSAVGGARRLGIWDTGNHVVNLGSIDPGQGVCIAFELGLPGSSNQPPGVDFGNSSPADNESQGDSATFDIRLDLTQQ